jgi:hypothetical protein
MAQLQETRVFREDDCYAVESAGFLEREVMVIKGECRFDQP